MTFAEAAAIDPDEHPGEVEHGVWKPVTRGTWRHGEIALRIGVLLYLYARENPGWSVSTCDPGTKLQPSPAVLRGPDVGIIRADRRPTGKGVDGWLDGAPDVAVEVMGDGQHVGDLIKKAEEYLLAGAKRVWVLDPDEGTVIVFSPPNQFRVVPTDGSLDGEDALPGFSCTVRELFE
jgi:Uma2 family endonuclease